MYLISFLLFLLAFFTPAFADPGCGDVPALKCYHDGMRWCGRQDDGNNYVCQPNYDRWCSARFEVLDAIRELCNGEWAHEPFEPWENKYKCWPLHHHVIQGPGRGWVEMHIIFRIKNYMGEARELDAATCSKPFPDSSGT